MRGMISPPRRSRSQARLRAASWFMMASLRIAKAGKGGKRRTIGERGAGAAEALACCLECRNGRGLRLRPGLGAIDTDARPRRRLFRYEVAAAGERGDEEGDILDAAGEAADRVEAGRQDLGARRRHQPEARLVATTPQNDAGRRIEPAVCVPKASGIMKSATRRPSRSTSRRAYAPGCAGCASCPG